MLTESPEIPVHKWFGSEPETAGALHFGRAIVQLPEHPEFGRFKGKWEISEPGSLNAKQFSELLERIRPELRKPMALVHIPGYRTRFQDALKTTAQIAEEIKFEGLPIAFSWPSIGTFGGYGRDAECADNSRYQLNRLIEILLQSFGEQQVHLYAHSMGSRVVTAALRDDVEYGAQKGMLGQSILVAPDVDASDCHEAWGKIQQHRICMRTTAYVNSRDKALIASRIIHGRVRAGARAKHWIGCGLDCVDVSKAHKRWFSLNHSYHLRSRSIITDIYAVLQNVAPDKRLGTEVRTSKHGTYYILLP